MRVCGRVCLLCNVPKGADSACLCGVRNKLWKKIWCAVLSRWEDNSWRYLVSTSKHELCVASGMWAWKWRAHAPTLTHTYSLGVSQLEKLQGEAALRAEIAALEAQQ